MTHKLLVSADERMKKSIEAVRREFTGIRSGKASPALLDTVRVEAYGQPVPIQQIGTVTAPEPRLIVVQPWDKSLIKAITRAIQTSELGLNPTDDGTVVRVPIPALTEDRRKDLVKLIAKLAEDGRVHVRQVRHDVNKEIKALEHDHAVPEDEAKRLTAEVQKLTDKAIAGIDELLKKKTAEVMEV
jgi:ribosome recycling factor